MKNDNSFVTRQQYRQIKDQHKSFHFHFGRGHSHLKMRPDSSFREAKVKNLAKRLDKIIFIIILLIILVYLILIFINF